jgi:hypothetical protein
LRRKTGDQCGHLLQFVDCVLHGVSLSFTYFLSFSFRTFLLIAICTFRA